MKSSYKKLGFIFLFLTQITFLYAQPAVKEVYVADGWANNSVNTVIFRKNALVTFDSIQFIAFYNPESNLVLGKRKVGTVNWTLKETHYKGNTRDAHNAISIMIDGNGYLHVSWDHHNSPLRYVTSIEPLSLELSEEKRMIGNQEEAVSYPEFYKMPDGNLLFFYRSGESGRGNLVINKYDIHSGKWTRLQDNLVDGEGMRNAYWQACVDQQGTIHISWVWRETPDVASNHDLCYVRSEDGGLTWEKSTGAQYELPIIASTAEYIKNVPQNSELINQTSMAADGKGNIYIAGYWDSEHSGIPHYQLVYFDGSKWHHQNTKIGKTPFSLSGIGTKQIPICRPQIVVAGIYPEATVYLLFRDEARGNKISVAKSKSLAHNQWEVIDLTDSSYGAWEPAYDSELWLKNHILHIFAQKVIQIDGEGVAENLPQAVKVLEWSPPIKAK